MEFSIFDTERLSVKKAMFGALALLTIGVVPALAADLPARTYTKAPVMVADPTTDWSGFYIGGDVGWAGARQHATDAGQPSP
jgi:outer membrane immunogenic protein